MRPALPARRRYFRDPRTERVGRREPAFARLFSSSTILLTTGLCVAMLARPSTVAEPAGQGRFGRQSRPIARTTIGSRWAMTTSARAGGTMRRVPLLVIGMLSMACGVWLRLGGLGWDLPLLRAGPMT